MDGPKGGFSLLELMAVMAIVALLSTLAVTSYFSAIRGMAWRSAQRNLTNALTFARQRASIDGCRVSFLMFNEIGAYTDDGGIEDLASSYVVCREIGRLSYVKNNNLLVDEFLDLDQLFKGDSTADVGVGALRLYNMTAGFRDTVRQAAVKLPDGDFSREAPYSSPTVPLQIDVYGFERLSGEKSSNSGGNASSADWIVGDVYGVEAMPAQTLPKGYAFEALKDADATVDAALKDIRHVTFTPDGQSVNANGLPAGVTFTIENKKDTKISPKIKFDVSPKGKIEVTVIKP
jgi:prepilin-type N-terminal cleavage/methylation domain-containing protein